MPDVWVSVDDYLPEHEGRYSCQIQNNGRQFEADRLLKLRSGKGYWLGGCRPFDDNSVVTHWLKKSE